MAHNVMNGGTVREIGGGKAMLNGTVYNIDSGKAMSGGTVYPISFGGEPCVVAFNHSFLRSDGQVVGPQGFGIVIKDSSGVVKTAELYEASSGEAARPSGYVWNVHEGSEFSYKVAVTIDAQIGDTLVVYVDGKEGSKIGGGITIYFNGTKVVNGWTSVEGDSVPDDDQCVSYSAVVTGNTTITTSDVNDSTAGPMCTVNIKMEG